MNDIRVNETIKMFENLNNVVSKAGGGTFTWEDLNNISAAELIMTLAPNNVRFIFVKLK